MSGQHPWQLGLSSCNSGCSAFIIVYDCLFSLRSGHDTFFSQSYWVLWISSCSGNVYWDAAWNHFMTHFYIEMLNSFLLFLFPPFPPPFSPPFLPPSLPPTLPPSFLLQTFIERLVGAGVKRLYKSDSIPPLIVCVCVFTEIHRQVKNKQKYPFKIWWWRDNRVIW